MTTLERAKSRIRTWRENPVQFVVDVFGVEPDAWQRDALAVCGGALTSRRRLAMKACTGPGKSAVLAWIGWHRLLCFAEKGEYPKGAAVSGQGKKNLKDNLWAELAKWQQRSELLRSAFTHQAEKIHSNHHPENWFLSARSFPNDANTEAIGRSLSGLHSRFPFILLDECGDMPPTVGQKAEQIFTGVVRDGLIAAAGNPTSTTGLLYVIVTNQPHLWVVITITADPDDPKRTPRVDAAHAREQISLYGKDNPWVMSTILGLFPPHGFNSLLSLAEVEAAMERTLNEDAYSYAQKRLGVDVARFGDDRTVIFPRQGLASFRPIEMRNARNPDIAARIMKAKADWGSEMEFIDDTGGYGGGVIDCLLQAGLTPFGVCASGKATDPRYANKRAECWFMMADWVKRGGCLPPIPALKGDLSVPTYTFVKGKFLMEPKELLKKPNRLGRSPDYGDALSESFALPDMPAANPLIIGQDGKGKVISDYNPFE